MKFGNLGELLLFIGFTLVFYSCTKDEPNPTDDPPTPIPGGGTVSGVFVNYDEAVTDSFLISDVSGRYTTLGGYSFLSSNDALELLFFFPDVSDTGFYAAPYSSDYYLRIIENGDTISTHRDIFNIHVTNFEQAQNYTLISGTFKIVALKPGLNGSYVEVQNGQFSNIPISQISPEANNVIYQGDQTVLSASEALIMDHVFFSRFEFEGESVHTTSFGLSSFTNSDCHSSFGRIDSQIAISNQNLTENTVSGRIKSTEIVDLDFNFDNLSYMEFPQLEDGQMALVFNFGEEILYFDSAKYTVSETLFLNHYIEAYSDGSIIIKIFVLFDHQGVDVEQGHSVVANTGISFLPDEVDVYSFIELSPSDSNVSFEFGSMMSGMPDYKQIALKGKNIPVEM